MSDERKRSVVPWIGGIVLALVLYVLSSGPAMLWAQREDDLHRLKTFCMVYDPLVRLTESSRTAYLIFDAYWMWWIRLGGIDRK